MMNGMTLNASPQLAFGWQRDLPDSRDLTPDHPQVTEALHALEASPRRSRRPRQTDLREFFPPVADQGHRNTSPAHACIALWEYFQRRAEGRMECHSPDFLYKVARRLHGMEGDCGVGLRSTLKAMVRFGSPLLIHARDLDGAVDSEPEPFLYSVSERCAPAQYVRLDRRNGNGRETLELVKTFLAAGFPVVFGFPVPTSLTMEPEVPYRPGYDAYRGGKAVVAVGYDDRRLGMRTGALLIRSSWGPGWGEEGYGWLPYVYVAEQLAADFWTMFSPQWLASGEFLRPELCPAEPASEP